MTTAPAWPPLGSHIEFVGNLITPDGVEETVTVRMTIGQVYRMANTITRREPVEDHFDPEMYHPADCLCDECVSIDRNGKLHYRDGSLVP